MRIDERKAPVHPYLARQISDFGFRQNPQGSNIGVRTKISPSPSSLGHHDLKAQLVELEEQGTLEFILVLATDVV